MPARGVTTVLSRQPPAPIVSGSATADVSLQTPKLEGTSNLSAKKKCSKPLQNPDAAMVDGEKATIQEPSSQ